eukprot:TRINITY_DN27588_c0_g1_i1.p1 TRINITY_DN27588_c0_g1~~TRINITY_DN27588_c0_g1_i1.p1  ORF type:complete len:671 (-),score=134.83 TRINITY_DN27588_c0_g1_i1:110-2122(-)
MPRFEVLVPQGIAFRHSTNLADKASNVKGARGGEILEGNLVGDADAWFELGTGESLFLPCVAPDGTQLLRQVQDARPGFDAGGPGKGTFLPWRGGDEEDFVGAGGACSSSSGAAGAAARRRTPGGPSDRSDELAALDRKYDKAYGGRGRPPPPRSAAGQVASLGRMVDSHERTTDYMHDFRDALEGMGVDTRNDPYLNRYAPQGGAVDAVHPAMALNGGTRPGTGGSLRSGGGGASSSRSGSATGSRAQPTPPGTGANGRRPVSRSSAASLAGPGGGGAGGGASGTALALCGSMVVSRSAASGTQGRWSDGPRNAIVPVKDWVSVKHGKEVHNHCSSGRCIDVSDRNILCMSVLGEKAVVGSADHGLKELNITAGQQLRNFYTKRFGHAEWVTTVSHCPDGKIISGGQDSKLCLWNSSGVACVDLTGHLGPVSRVRVDGQGKLAISSSYDRTLSVWDLKSKRALASCSGHSAPVMDFVWWDSVVASGDRSGVVKLWDTNHAQNVGTLKGHKGHITAMLAVPDGEGVPTIVTGAQDGHLRVWDLRQKLNTHSMGCHPGGAVNDIGVTVKRSQPLIVSTGADGRVLVLEPRSNYAPVFTFTDVTKDFLYSLLVLDSVAFTGDGHGQVTCFDLQEGQRKYSLTAGQNAIRCLGATAANLVCAGDDGNAIIFDF